LTYCPSYQKRAWTVCEPTVTVQDHAVRPPGIMIVSKEKAQGQA
jgi:hypothetical protein